MMLLDLKCLAPGDVILTEGHPQVAAATNSPFGHAEIVLNRLSTVESAGKGMDVAVNLLIPHVWTKGQAQVAAIDLGGNAAVLRALTPPTEKDIVSRAFGELGRDYASAAKLGQLPSITRRARAILLRQGRRQPSQSGLDGRFCSEVVALVLGWSNCTVTLGDLMTDPRLAVVPNACFPKAGWCDGGEHTVTGAALQTAAAIDGDVIADVWADLQNGKTAVQNGTMSADQLLAQVDAKITAKLSQDIAQIAKLRTLGLSL